MGREVVMIDQKAMAQRVARQFKAGLALDERMKALLLKLRKGADASLSMGQLIKVLALLGGWRVEEIVGLTQIHYDDHAHALRTEDEAKARAAWENLKKLEVASLPATPKLGGYYVMDLQPLKAFETPWANARKEHGAEYKLWVGTPGYRFTDPEGKVYELLPSRHDFSSGMSIQQREQGLPEVDVKNLKKRLRLYDLLPWMKEHTTYMAQINQTLGMEEHVPAAQRTRDNTGTCGVCFRNIKIIRKGEHTFMALHGYNRPGDGFIVGRCPGGDHAPYELSAEATKRVLKDAQAHLDGIEKYLRTLEDPNLQEFDESHFDMGAPAKVIRRDYAHWEAALDRHKSSVKYKVAAAKAERDIFNWLVEHWELRALPKEGDKEIDWWTIAARKVPRS